MGSAGWKSRLRLICLQGFVFQGTVFLLRPTVTYRALELGVPSRWLWLLATAFALLPLLIAIPVGGLADRYGERIVVVSGALILLLASSVFLWGPATFASLLVGSSLLGAGHLLCILGQQSLVANLVPRAALDAGFGLYTFAGSLGQALGPLGLMAVGAGGTLPRTSHGFALGAAGAVALAVLAVCFCAPRQVPEVRPTGLMLGRILRIPGLGKALLVSSVAVTAADIMVVYLPALGHDRGLTAGTVGALLFTWSLSGMTSRLLLPRLTGRWGRPLVLAGAFAAAGAGLAFIAMPLPVGIALVAASAVGAGLGVSQPLTLSWLAETSPAGMRGRVVSVRIVGNRLGQVVFPGVVGSVASGAGVAGVFLLTSGALAVAAAAARSLVMKRSGVPDDP